MNVLRTVWRWLNGYQPEQLPDDGTVAIYLNQAVICFSCRSISNAKGDKCPACLEVGNLVSVARIFTAHPELGQITYIYKGIGVTA